MATRPVDRLQHIKAAIQAARDGVGGLNADIVANLPFLIGGLSYQLLIISEAARSIPADWKQDLGTSIDWRALEDLGNHLRHAYHHVDIGAIWAMYENDLPALEAAIERMIAAHGPTSSRSPTS